jgi:hypothetical protein
LITLSNLAQKALARVWLFVMQVPRLPKPHPSHTFLDLSLAQQWGWKFGRFWAVLGDFGRF